MDSPLPQRLEVAQLLGALLDKQVRIVPMKTALALAQVERVASYIDDSGKILFAILADLPFLATVGGALALIPPMVVAEAVKARALTTGLSENAYEVLNIAASLFNHVDGTKIHVRLKSLDLVRELEPALRTRVAAPAHRLDSEVFVQTYGPCHLSLLHL